jgi:hypothetical protein
VVLRSEVLRSKVLGSEVLRSEVLGSEIVEWLVGGLARVTRFGRL